MNIHELNKKLNEIDLLSAFPFIEGYGIGIKKDKETGLYKNVLTFTVPVKIKKENIIEKFLLPKSLSSFNIDIETTVEDSPNNVTTLDTQPYDKKQDLIDYFNKISNISLSGSNYEYHMFKNYEKLYKEYKNDITISGYLSGDILSADNVEGTNPNYIFADDYRIEPVKSHRQANKPLSGGVSGIYYCDLGPFHSSDATLGMFVRDKQDRRIVALSNAHVYTATLLIGEEAKKYGSGSRGNSELGRGANTNLDGLSARSPAFFSKEQYDFITLNRQNLYGDRDPTVNHIGIPKRTSYNRVELVDYNWDLKVDSAIVELSSYHLIDSSSNSILNFKEKGPYQFATKEEIYSILDPDSENFQAPIFRAGRTLGPLGYPGSEFDEKVKNFTDNIFAPVTLTNLLTTSDSVNILTYGLSTIDVYGAPYFGVRGYTNLFLSSDRTKLHIAGNRYYYFKGKNGTSKLLFVDPNGDALSPYGVNISPLTGEGLDIELAVQNNDKISKFGIRSVNQSFFYITDNNRLFVSGIPPNSQNSWLYSAFGSTGVVQAVSLDPYIGALAGVAGSRQTTLGEPVEIIFDDPEITNPGIKHYFHDLNKSFLLTNDNKFFVRGANGYNYPDDYTSDDDYDDYHFSVTGAGQGVTSLRYTKISDNIIDFACDFYNYRGDTNIFAVSGDNKLYVAFSHEFYQIKDKVDQPEYYPRSDVELERERDEGSYSSKNFFSHKLMDGVSLHYDEELIFPKTHLLPDTTAFTYLCASYDLLNNRVPVIIDGQDIDIKGIVARNNTGMKAYCQPTLSEGPGTLSQIMDFECPFYLIDVNDKLIGYTGKRSFYSRSHYSNPSDTATYIMCNNDFFYWHEKSQFLYDEGSVTGPNIPAFLSAGDGERKNELDYVVTHHGIANATFNLLKDYGITRYRDMHEFGKNTTYPLSSLWENMGGKLGTGTYIGSAHNYSTFPSISSGSGRFFTFNSVPFTYYNDFLFSDGTGLSAMSRNFNNMYPTVEAPTFNNVDIVVTQLEARSNVRGSAGILNYGDLIRIESKYKQFPVAQGGDSGTIVFAQLSSNLPSHSTWKVIGQLFAGSPEANDNFGLCCDIVNIQRELNIEPWEGNIEE